MTQTLALLLDAYRELNAKKLFWITLAISGAVVTAFASVGIDEKSMTFFTWHVPFPGVNSRTFPPAVFYTIAFTKWGIGFWLSWLGTIFALVSTAGIFPDFIAGGSIELTLSKPMGRMRLFLTKYASGLLFVVLQVGIFSAASFLVIGIRGGKWEPRLFLAIPLVTCFFSYLFCICTLLGVLTRSTIASLLLTLLIWVGLWGANIADELVVTGREATGMQVERLTKRMERMEAGTTRLLAKRAESAEPAPDGTTPEATPKPAAPTPAAPPTQADLDAANPMLPATRARIADAQMWNDRLTWWSKMIFRVKTMLPKTEETTALVKRELVSESELAGTLSESGREEVQLGVDDEAPVDPRELKLRLERSGRARSIPWILGTSLGFEAVLVGIAGWIFCRRDF